MKVKFHRIFAVVSTLFAITSFAVQGNSNTSKAASTELIRYGQIYTQMIQLKLVKSHEFKGKVCKLQLHLSRDGKVSEISSNGYEKLCKSSEKAVKDAGVFPMPADQELAKKLRKIRIKVTL